jgi:hypothetical protein
MRGLSKVGKRCITFIEHILDDSGTCLCLRLDGKHPPEFESHGKETSHSRTGAGPVLINNDRLSSIVLRCGEFLGERSQKVRHIRCFDHICMLDIYCLYCAAVGIVSCKFGLPFESSISLLFDPAH